MGLTQMIADTIFQVRGLFTSQRGSAWHCYIGRWLSKIGKHAFSTCRPGKTNKNFRTIFEFRTSVTISSLLDQLLPNLRGMLRLCHRTQLSYRNCTFIKSQDGGRCHLEFLKFVVISILMDQSSPNLVRTLRICQRRNCQIKIAYSPKLKMAAAAVLSFEHLLPFLYYWTNPHQV